MAAPPWHKAIHAAAEGCVVDLDVQPGANRDEVPSGYNQWRERIQARVRAAPQDGQANEALLTAFAATLRLPRDRLTLAAGTTSRRKRIHIQGLEPNDLHRLLEEALRGS